jgi:hypothetical protein
MTDFVFATCRAVGPAFELNGGDTASASPVHRATDDVSP